MGIRESLLNTITSVADSDFVRIVTSAGTSSKATVKNLFKGFESNLSAKSSLTDSDYFRVVGSDNEAYKQSVSAVKTALGIDALNSKRAYAAWNTSLTFTLPIGRQALVFVGANEIYLLWNPSDKLSAYNVFTYSGATKATFARGSSNTQIVVTCTSNQTISALVI